MADRPVSPITDDTRRAAFAAGRAEWAGFYPGIGDDAVVDLIIGKVLDIVAGVPVGSTASAGALVSPGQTTDHADLSVSPVTDDMVKRGAAALTGTAGEVYEVRFPDPMVAYRIAEQVLTAGLAGCTAAPEPPERGEVASRMARGRQWLAHAGGARTGMPVPPWDGLTPAEQEAAELEARHWIQAAVNTGVKIVPPGCTVVELPDPDGTSIEGDPLWSAHVDYEETIFACVDSAGHPVVEGPFSEGPMATVTAEMFGLRLLAAAREARRLASGSQVGDQHGG